MRSCFTLRADDSLTIGEKGTQHSNIYVHARYAQSIDLKPLKFVQTSLRHRTAATTRSFVDVQQFFELIIFVSRDSCHDIMHWINSGGEEYNILFAVVKDYYTGTCDCIDLTASFLRHRALTRRRVNGKMCECLKRLVSSSRVGSHHRTDALLFIHFFFINQTALETYHQNLHNTTRRERRKTLAQRPESQDERGGMEWEKFEAFFALISRAHVANCWETFWKTTHSRGGSEEEEEKLPI